MLFALFPQISTLQLQNQCVTTFFFDSFLASYVNNLTAVIGMPCHRPFAVFVGKMPSDDAGTVRYLKRYVSKQDQQKRRSGKTYERRGSSSSQGSFQVLVHHCDLHWRRSQSRGWGGGASQRHVASERHLFKP